MARGYPRFLFSNPGTKNEGPFIIHTLEPLFICTPEFDKKRNIVDCRLLKSWSPAADMISIMEVMEEIPKWFKMSGIQQSSNSDDVLISAVGQLRFLSNYADEFTLEETKELIKLLFPTKTKTIYDGSSSYGLKHLFEHVSQSAVNDGHRTSKYCSNDTTIQAFEELGFKWKQDGPNRYMNISAAEINRAKRLFWNT